MPAHQPNQRSTANHEVKFLEDMIDHHQMAVEMADVCSDKAVHTELESLCDSIMSVQTAEIHQMQHWLQTWYGISYASEMNAGEEHMVDRMAAMSGAEFEMMFLEMMIRHHEDAIADAKAILDKASHQELITLARNIITSQQAEVEQMRTWLCDWYGTCR